VRWIVSILINAVLFLALAGFMNESFFIDGITAAIAASAILSILNVLVRPVLIILTLPLTIISLGSFIFVVNAITLLLVDKLMGSAFEITSFWTALGATILLSIANLIISHTINKKED
jgi:putative membrane protein